MAINENVTLNTGITVGAAQTWTIAAGKVLTVAGNINTHISPLTVNCTGEMIVQGAIRDVRGDSRWDGLLASSSGSVTKNGTGTLTFSGNNTYTGDTTIAAGTIKLGATQAGLYEGMLSSYFDISTANPKTAIQLTTLAANTNIGATQTWVYTGYINNPGGSNVTWTFAENYDDDALLKIDGVQILNNSGWNTQTSSSYMLTPGLHAFELRLGGNDTPNGPASGGVSGTGLGVAFNKNDGSGYQALTDPGDGSLFRLVNSLGGSLPAASAVVMSSDTTLDLNNYSTDIGSLADADGSPTGHRVLLGSGTLTLGGNNTSTTFSGGVSGTGGITKTGNGTFTIEGVNTYGGTTLITPALSEPALTMFYPTVQEPELSPLIPLRNWTWAASAKPLTD